MMKLLVAPLALLLSACSIAEIGAGVSVLESGLSSVAQKIDKGRTISEPELPAACKITADLARTAETLAEAGVLGVKASDRLASAANAASALAASDLCNHPTRNPVALSLQIASAVAAMRRASADHAAITASAVAAGVALSNR